MRALARRGALLAACGALFTARALALTPHARELYAINWAALLTSDPSEAVQSYGRWCGGPECGMINCCGGKPCAACEADAETFAEEGGAACLAECPPVDEIDALCMRHDFCVSAQLARMGGWSNCTYYIAGEFAVPANQCSCDAALYAAVAALGGRDGFKGNLLTWLSSSWGKCLDVDADGNVAGCLPFRGAVAPQLHKPGEAGDPETRLVAVLGAVAGVALPFALFAAHRRRGARPSDGPLLAAPSVELAVSRHT
jgi:hypothetical protein